MSAENSHTPAVLVLADGRAFHGRSVGAAGEAIGNLRFDTEQTGYFEAITDPETATNQAPTLLAFTTPHIGNTGIADPNREPTVAGIIMRDPSRIASHWDSRGDLEPYLVEHGVVAISHIDTRALIRHAGRNHRAGKEAEHNRRAGGEVGSNHRARGEVGGNHPAGGEPVAAGLFTGERAWAPVHELVENVKTVFAAHLNTVSDQEGL